MFHDVYTGVDIRQKKALSVTELHKLLYEDPKSERLRRTQTIAALMFQFCGMSFADLAHLEKSALDRNVLQYNRIKTKTPMSLEILESAKEMMNQLRSNKPALPDCPDYLFDILHTISLRINCFYLRPALHPTSGLSSPSAHVSRPDSCG